ncbi:MAG: PrgI family protein [Patescibacteria group bacterium]
MRFTVPQFIDAEDKIFGPITTRQFIILLITAGLVFVTFKLADFVLFLVLGILEVLLAGLIAFVKINGQPFHYFLLNLVQTFAKPRLRIWDKTLTDGELRAIIMAPPPAPPTKRLIKERVATAKLSELTLVVNTGGVYNPEE